MFSDTVSPLTNTTVSDVSLTHDQYFQLYIWASAAVPIVLFGSFGNILTLIVILRAKWYATGIQVLILTMTVCGVLTTSIVHPISIIGAVVGDARVWLIPGVCTVYGFFAYSVLCMIPTTCAMIAINRFCLIVIPSRTRYITSKAGGGVMSVISCGISMATFVFPLLQIDGQFGLIEPLRICMWQQWKSTQRFQSLFFLLIYVLPCMVIAVCYVSIFVYLRAGHCRGRRSSTTTTFESYKASRKLERLIQATKMMGVTFLVYVLCFLPLNILAWKSVDVYTATHATVFAWLILLYSTSDCLHPVIYALMNRDFSNAYMDLLGRCQVYHRSTELSLKDMMQSEKMHYLDFRRVTLPPLDRADHNLRRLIPRDSIPRDNHMNSLALPHGGVYCGPQQDSECDS